MNNPRKIFGREEDRVGHPTDRRLTRLESEDKAEVIQAVESLSGGKEGSRVEDGLLGIMADWEEDETSAPLWAMVTLGKIGSFRAIPALLGVLDSDVDYWQEAAMEALTMITLKHGEKALGPLERFIEDRLENDPFESRIYAYEPFTVLTGSRRSESFLIRMFESDRRLTGSIAHDLVPFNDRRVLPLLRRAIEFACRSGDVFEERELRDAYCLLDGALPTDAYPPLWRKPWQERWSRQLNRLGQDEETIERLEENSFKFDPGKDETYEEEARQEIKIRETHPLADFDVEAYLSVRERCPIEEDFQSALRLCGLDGEWTVERVQTMISRASSPERALKELIGDGTAFPSRGAVHEFSAKMLDLWEMTPRENEQGLAPVDLDEIPALRQANRRFYSRLEKETHNYFTAKKLPDMAEKKVGRNDPCPCGSGKKYKKCHGQS